MLERLFQKIFISIVPVVNGHEVLAVALKNKKILFKERRQFGGSEPSTTMNRYIQEVMDLSPIYYISTINTEPYQGAYEGCSRLHATQHKEDTRVSELCRNKKWSWYASLNELHSLMYQYQAVGLDFIFSPFSIIEYNFSDKIQESFALYAFAMPGMFTIAIFDGGTLEYAHHYSHKTATEEEETSEPSSLDFTSPLLEEDEKDGLIHLDDIEGLEDLDILDDLDSLSDIDDLDELEEVEECSEEMPAGEEKRLGQEHSSLMKGDMDSAAEDYQ
ncbi:MAG: hypothetical protein Q8K81_03340, partial [Sulfuricurvum sp.]|nr:hypothetical protein [Sulfuricurvum sp.]